MVMERIRDCYVMPVTVVEDVKDAVPTAHALLAGGIDVMEITLRTDAALESIKAVAEHVPDVLVGAGTVTSLEQGREAVACGAKFIVSPGLDVNLVNWCVENQIPVIPGCVTPTEIMQALPTGLKIFKFFPANVYGGLKAMKALSGPFVGTRFIPTGGVSAETLDDYLAAPFVYAVGGSWICSKKDISEGNFKRIEALSREARDKVTAARK